MNSGIYQINNLSTGMSYIGRTIDWAVKNNATRSQAIKKFGSSWGSLKKFQPEWEATNGTLSIPKRASAKRITE